MYQFRNKENGFKELRKQVLIKIIPLGLIAVTGGIAMSEINSNNRGNDVNVLPFVIPMALVAMSVGLFLGIKRQKALFESYILTIDENTITRQQDNTPTVSIQKDAISDIIKNVNGSITIKGKDSRDIIGVPAQIENRSELETHLRAFKDITVKSSEHILQKLIIPLVLIVVGLLAIVNISTHKLLVGVSGTLLLVILIASFIQTQRSKNVDSKTKRSMYFLIFVLINIVGQMYLKLNGVI